MTVRAQWVCLAVAAVFGIAYTVVTPPFEVPDEVFHFWRPQVVARGQLMPQRRGEPDAGDVPVGIKTLVYVMSLRTPAGKYTAAQMRAAAAIPLESVKLKPIRFVSTYTLVPYLPQTLVGIAARLFELRPLVVFYLGRLANLFAALTLVGLAMRVATELVAPIAAATLLPETLSEFASWSADPLTIALAFLLTAMLAAERITWATAVTAFFLGLCKPAYFLIALLVLLTRVRPRLKAAVVASSLLGTFLAWAYNSLGAYNQRIGVPIEARAQLACIVGEPLRFVRIFLHDVTEHGWTYLEQMTGRFGSVLQVQPSALLPWAELVLLLAVALTGAPSLRAAFRVSAAVVIALTIGGILLATFLFSSIACGEAIEGVQGRYFLPLLPLALTLPAIGRFKLALPVVVAGAVVCNVVALAAIARSFW